MEIKLADASNYSIDSLDSYIRTQEVRNVYRLENGEAGAVALYASACSSEETINFYKAMGFTVSDDPIPECVEDEPFDIQMECRI